MEEKKYIKALEVSDFDHQLYQGDSIKIYGEETTITGFSAQYNDALEKWETIIYTVGRGDPFERTLPDIEVLEDHPRSYEQRTAQLFHPPQGAVWVKASERLPGVRAEVKWRIDDVEWGVKETPLGMWYNKPNTFHKYEWYDEGTAAATREDDGLALLAWLNKNEWGSAGNGEYINHNTGRIIKEEKLYQEFKQRKEK